MYKTLWNLLVQDHVLRILLFKMCCFLMILTKVLEFIKTPLYKFTLCIKNKIRSRFEHKNLLCLYSGHETAVPLTNYCKKLLRHTNWNVRKVKICNLVLWNKSSLRKSYFFTNRLLKGSHFLLVSFDHIR